jgi:hypothetical protein
VPQVSPVFETWETILIYSFISCWNLRMRFVSTEAMVRELERKLKDCDERMTTSSEAEKRELEEESERYRHLLALAKSNTVLW